ncbi:MAG: hypothetical protein Q9195_002740 [Heterodermia aff. obscurata]
MFHNGDLQSGISRALAASKLVACFVRGSGLEKSQFRQSILQTLERDLPPSETVGHIARSPITVTTSSPGSTIAEPDHSPPVHIEDDTVRQPTPASLSPPASSGSSSTLPTTLPATAAMPSTSSSSSRLRDMLAERRQRLEKDKKDKEDAEKANRKAKAESQCEAIHCNPTSAKAQQADYAKQQQKKKQEAKLERERILRDIENNKAERKEKEERRKALAHADAKENDRAEGLGNLHLMRKMSQRHNKASNECAVQVRLFDGSTIRHRFPAEQSLRIHVRSWIAEQPSYGADTPYTFKQILTPKPNRSISIAEEEQSLYSLNFVPSATLLMLPVQSYTSAYTSDQSILFRGVFASYNMVNSGVRMVTGALGYFLGMGGTNTAGSRSEPIATFDPAPSLQRNSMDLRPQINVRTLRDQHEDHGKHQLYNGNQVG